MRTAVMFFAAALALAPGWAGANTIALSNGDTPSVFRQSRVALTPHDGFAPVVTSELRQRPSAGQTRGAPDALVARFAPDGVQYIEGPSWDYQLSRHGPMFEVGALGGGMENAPYLAHVAMDWRF
ncbi:MAG: hypothetical protein ABIM50_07820 [Novosphingobium sp.]